MRLGLIMLKNGASSDRADQAMRRAGVAMGAARIEAYVTPTGIIASAYSEADVHTQIARIHAFGVNFQRVYETELLLRGLHMNVDPQVVNAELERIENAPTPYPVWVTLLAAGIGCGSFSMLRGGGVLEFIAACLAGIVVQAVRQRMNAIQLRVIASTVLCSFVGSFVAIVLVRWLAAPQPELGVIASALPLVPGVALVTSLLDLLNGNLVSGITRGVYALLLLAAIGVGVLISITLLGFTIL